MNKQHKKSFVFLLSILTSLGLVSCGSESHASEETSSVIHTEDGMISLSHESLTLDFGEIVLLKAKINFETENILSWSSSDETIASVSPIGRVQGIKEGSCTITASVDGYAATCTVTVQKSSISLNVSEGSVDLMTQRTLQLTATGSSNYKWKSSDASVATVSSDGLVTGNSKGDVTITVSTGRASASCIVHVTAPDDFYFLSSAKNADVVADPGHWYYYSDKTTGIEGKHGNGEAILSVNNTADVAYYLRYMPDLSSVQSSVYDATVTFTTTVDGYVRLGGGNSNETERVYVEKGTHTLTFLNRSKSSSNPMSIAMLKSDKNDDFMGGNYTLTVSDPVISEGVSISKRNLTLNITDDPYVLTAGTSGDNVEWSISDDTVASLTPNGNKVTVTPLAEGSAVVTAKIGELTNTCNLTVVSRTIKLDQSQVIVDLDSDTKTTQLSAVVSDGSDLTWTSSNTAVATVSETGLVTGLSSGEAVITASSGSVSATCTFVCYDSSNHITDSCEGDLPSGNSTTIANNVNKWYMNGTYFKTLTMENGVITLTREKGDGSTTSSPQQIRYLYSKDGVNAYVGDYYLMFKVQGTGTGLMYGASVNGNSNTTYKTIEEGVQDSGFYKLNSTGSSTFFNIKLKGYGDGTIVLSDIYIIPVN